MHEFTHYQARDIMTWEPVVLKGSVRLIEVEKIFEAHDFNGLPVTGNEKELIGMITKLDLLRAFTFEPQSVIPKYRDIMDQEVGSIMNPAPETVSPETPATRILQKMVDSRKKSFPVVVDRTLVGIVAREDILRALREASEGRLPDRLLKGKN